MTTTIAFSPPVFPPASSVHHGQAATANAAVGEGAIGVLRDVLSGDASYERLLLKAAAGAGKSHVLRRMVVNAVSHPRCARVAIVAFTNKQVQALATPLGEALSRDEVCLFVSKDALLSVPEPVHAAATVTARSDGIPSSAQVVLATCHRLGAVGERRRQEKHLGFAYNGSALYDVLFADEAWQIPHYLFDRVLRFAPVKVGVGDVGQLPPLEAGTNPWRGDPGYNPFRAWPTDFDADPQTWSAELPAVWRPAAGHLALWRAFYPEWQTLHCVAAPEDRTIETGLGGAAAALWQQVATGVPTLLEVDGLEEPEAADIDLPLMGFVEALLDELFGAGFALRTADYDATGTPTDTVTSTGPGETTGDPLIAILATRNQAVDDAADAVERLRERHGLASEDLLSSTVDSYQGQTNGITIAVHPLTGAAELNEFNSAFGRLAVTCTRATHGLLMVTRPGLDGLLGEAPARPGTPFGEPGTRHLPRQTHQRILATFARGRLQV